MELAIPDIDYLDFNNVAVLSQSTKRQTRTVAA